MESSLVSDLEVVVTGEGDEEVEKKTFAVLIDLCSVMVHTWKRTTFRREASRSHLKPSVLILKCCGVMAPPRKRACSSRGRWRAQSSLTLWSTTISVMKITAMLHLDSSTHTFAGRGP